jgi:hypothetical protein
MRGPSMLGLLNRAVASTSFIIRQSRPSADSATVAKVVRPVIDPSLDPLIADALILA